MTLASTQFIEEAVVGNLTDMSLCTEVQQPSIFNCSDPEGYFFLQKVYPPVIEQETRLTLLAIVFIICFIVSLSGNVSVLTIIHGILKERGALHRHTRSGDHTIIYICALCITDVCISLSLPTAITDNLLGFWLFGRVLCKAHHVCGSVGRIVSTFLITAITFDRYASICRPLESKYRTHRFVYTVIAGGVTMAIILLLPLLFYSDTKEYVIHEVTGEYGGVTQVRVHKCSDTMPREVFIGFTLSTFTLGFVIPLSLIVYFDYKLLRQLAIHSRSHPNTMIPMRRIFRYTVFIAVIYFLGWTPYWCSVLYGSYYNLRYGEAASPNRQMLFVIYVLHAFPYLAIATNWIFYGLLNTQLQYRGEASFERTFTQTGKSRNGESPRDSIALMRSSKKQTENESIHL